MFHGILLLNPSPPLGSYKPLRETFVSRKAAKGLSRIGSLFSASLCLCLLACQRKHKDYRIAGSCFPIAAGMSSKTLCESCMFLSASKDL
jgi:hypothetical protein